MPGPNDKLTVSAAGLDLIAGFEGWSATPYNDSANHATIGYGHLLHKGPVTAEDKAKYGKGLSKQEGLALLNSDVSSKAADVKRLVKVALNQGQFDALVSFAYNVGSGNLSSSTLLKKLNAGDYAGAANEFANWTKAGGKVMRGLQRRRAAEAAMFRGEGQPSSPPAKKQPATQPAKPPAKGWFTRTLREGDSGNDVKELQKRLKLNADGEFGPKTKAAVVAFQKSKKLTADGVVGPKTAAALG